MTEAEERDDNRSQKIQLLAAIRERRRKNALKLLQEGAGVDFQDLTGSYPLHYAATEGYDDVIELLLEKGANVKAWNNNGRTALHQAAMHGQARSVVILVAGGALVRTLDQKGCLPLEYAVQNKHVDVVELLCLFGSEPLLLDWSWMTQPDIKKKKIEYAMAKIMRNQVRLSPGYRHTGIIFDVARITQEEGPLVHLEKTGIQVKVEAGQEHYYLYLCQTEEAYRSPPPLEPNEEAFGHLLECQTWGSKLQSITLTVTVDRVLRQTEEIILQTATRKGSVEHVERQELDNVGITIVTITVPLERVGITYFAMASREKKQVFQLSKEAVVLKPENEPEAEIDIPAGTFDSCELLVKFVDTTEISEEEALDDDDKRKSGDILMTSILDVSTSDGQQPNNDIEMKIPVTAKEQSEGVVVLTTSNPDPNLEEWTWDDLPAEIDKDGKAVFKIDHFSIYSGASKPLFESDPKAVKDEIRNSFLKMRKIEFIVGMKTPELDETKTDLVIACGTKRSIKMFKTTFDKRYTWFKLDSNTTLPMVPEGQIFQIVLHGNLKERSDDNNMKLVFKGSGQESSRALEIISTSTDPQEMTGEIEIFQETKCPRPDTKVVVSIGCSCWQRMEERIIKSTEFDIKTKPMCKIPFNVTLRKRVPEVESGELTSEEVACPPPDVTWKKLNEAVRDLSHSEAKQLGYQLGLKPSHMKKIEDDTTREVEFSLNVIKRWRLFMAKNDMVSQLQGALEAIGRSDMIQVIKKKQSISN